MNTLSSPARLGLIAGLLLAVGSYGAGATRARGGVLEGLGLSFLSYGHGSALSQMFVLVGIVLMVYAWARLGRELTLDNVRRCLWQWAVPLVFAAPLFSRDVYSYLMQGAMVREGFDPYTEGASVLPGPYLFEVSMDWRNTTTPYGPLHLWLGDGITSLVGNNVTLGVMVYSIIAAVGYAGIAWATPRIATAVGGNPAMALWLGVLNPVVLLHLVGGLHNEAIMVALVNFGVLAALRMPVLRGAVVGAFLVGLAVSMKATGIIALPFLVWIALTRRHEVRWTWPGFARRLPELIGYGLLHLAVCIAALAAVTELSGTSWGWLSEISGNTKVINPLAFPSAVASTISAIAGMFTDAVSFNVLVSFLRPISMVLMMVGLVVTWLLFQRTSRHNVAGISAAYGVTTVFNAVTLPWYYISPLTLIGAVKPPKWVIWCVFAFSAFLTLSFTGDGNNRLYNIPWTLATLALTYWMTRVAGLTAPWLERGASPRGQDAHAARPLADQEATHPA